MVCWNWTVHSLRGFGKQPWAPPTLSAPAMSTPLFCPSPPYRSQPSNEIFSTPSLQSIWPRVFIPFSYLRLASTLWRSIVNSPHGLNNSLNWLEKCSHLSHGLWYIWIFIHPFNSWDSRMPDPQLTDLPGSMKLRKYMYETIYKAGKISTPKCDCKCSQQLYS